jgi:Fe-S cluster assembly protein SufD
MQKVLVKRDFMIDPQVIRQLSPTEVGYTRRMAAYQVFQQMPMPNKKDHIWRKTPVDQLDPRKFQFVPEKSNHSLATEKTDSSADEILVHYQSGRLEESLPKDLIDKGLILCSLREAEEMHSNLLQSIIGTVVTPQESKFSALAHMLDSDGVMLYIPKGIKVDPPIHHLVENIRTDRLNTFHLLIILDERSSATFIQEWPGSEGKARESLLTGLVEIKIGKGAQLDFIELQTWQEKRWNFLHERAEVHQDGRMNWTLYADGGRYSRSFLGVKMIGESAQVNLTGIYLGTQKTQLDFDTHQQHSVRATQSDLLFKGTLANDSKSVWAGMIKVEKAAMKTDGYQANRNLILCGSPQVESIPGLEILTDDVRCSHGVSVGEIDFDQLFYLSSRGIPENEAKQLIAQGFLNSGLSRISNQLIRSKMEKRIQTRLREVFCE